MVLWGRFGIFFVCLLFSAAQFSYLKLRVTRIGGNRQEKNKAKDSDPFWFQTIHGSISLHSITQHAHCSLSWQRVDFSA